MVSVFVVDKKLKRIVKPTKDLITKSLARLGVKVLAVIAGTSYAFWEIVRVEDVALMRKTLEYLEMNILGDGRPL